MSHTIILHRICQLNSFLADYFLFSIFIFLSVMEVATSTYVLLTKYRRFFWPQSDRILRAYVAMGRIFGIWPFHNRDFSFFKFWIVWFLSENQKKWMTSDSARATTFPNPHTSSCQFFPKGTKIVMSSRGGKGEIDRRLFMKGWVNTVCRNLI
jgi:hypothetical protein